MFSNLDSPGFLDSYGPSLKGAYRWTRYTTPSGGSKGLWRCSRAGGGAARTAKEQGRGGYFGVILHNTFLLDDNAHLGVIGVELGLGEGLKTDGELRRARTSHTCFSLARRCTLPAAGELPSRALRSMLERMELICGRCKTRAKTLPASVDCFSTVKGGLLKFEIDFEFLCRTFSSCSTTGEIRGSPHSSGRFRAKVRAE